MSKPSLEGFSFVLLVAIIAAAPTALLITTIITIAPIQSAYADSIAKTFSPGQLSREAGTESAKTFAPGTQLVPPNPIFPTGPITPGQIQKDIQHD